MVLQIHYDASYLSESKARSTAGRFFFLGSKAEPNKPIWLNYHIHVLCKIIDVVCGSAAETEIGGIHLNA